MILDDFGGRLSGLDVPELQEDVGRALEVPTLNSGQGLSTLASL